MSLDLDSWAKPSYLIVPCGGQSSSPHVLLIFRNGSHLWVQDDIDLTTLSFWLPALLEKGFQDPEVQHNDGTAAISWAKTKEHKSLYKQLLKDAANNLKSLEEFGTYKPEFYWEMLHQWDNPPEDRTELKSYLYQTAIYDVQSHLYRKSVICQDEGNPLDRKLHKAVSERSMDEMLSSLGVPGGPAADINSFNLKGETALHSAVFLGFTEIVEVLLRKGAKVDALNLSGQSPLHLASITGRVGIARILLNHGATIEGRDLKEGATALHFGVQGGFWTVVDLLLQKGANIDLQTYDNELGTKETPLQRVLRMRPSGYKGMVNFLLGKNANPNIKDKNEKTALFYLYDDEGSFQLLLRYKANVSVKNSSGETILHDIISSGGNEAVIDHILRSDISLITIPDRSGSMPLYLAVSSLCEAHVKALLRNGANVNFKNTEREETALHKAVRLGSIPIVQLLLKSGAKANAKDGRGISPHMDAMSFYLTGYEESKADCDWLRRNMIRCLEGKGLDF